MQQTISALLSADCYPHTVSELSLVQTHISWIILTGKFAYKIKKPVDFGFLDFSTLEKRRHCCEEEVRLNRRLAEDVYLDVVSINRNGNRVEIEGKGKVVEYAVKMVQFPQSAQLDHKLENNEIGNIQIDSIANLIADFHCSLPAAEENSNYGSVEKVWQPVEENFSLIQHTIDQVEDRSLLKEIKQWCEKTFADSGKAFTSRKMNGFIRECHGDLHLQNMIWVNEKPVAFDCIEFNPELRWIDVISDLAFLLMDLQFHNRDELANRLLNTYLEKTGDYVSLVLLRFYLCYRAMVRAKVSVLTACQSATSGKEKQTLLEDFHSYLKLAESYTRTPVPRIVIMRGVSASGKSTVAQMIADRLGFIRIRSDVERKRLFTNENKNRQGKKDVNAGLYSRQATEETYARLLSLCRQITGAGYSVVVDATFLHLFQRENFQLFASSHDIPYRIIDVTAPSEVLFERIEKRQHDVSDANRKVLEHQLINLKQTVQSEEPFLIKVSTCPHFDIKGVIALLSRN